MALDPSISLAVRPPQFNIQVPNPLEQFGQVLSLGNLMQQRQLFPLELQSKQLGLEQQRLAYQQDLNLMNLIAHPENLPTSPLTPAVTPAPAAPGTVMIGQGQGGTAIHSPDAGVSWVNSTTGAPYAGPRYGETPISMGPAGVPYDASAATVQPILPPVSTPAPSPVTAPAPAAPPVATPPAAAPETAPPVPSGGIPGMPSWERMIQVGGQRAFPWIKNINEAYTAQLTTEAKQLENAQLRNKEATSILNGMVDNESKNRLLQDLGLKGYLTWPEVRQYRDMDFNDPRFQARKDSASQQALTYDQVVDLGIKRNKELRDQNKEVRDWTDYWDKQHIEQERQLREKVNAMSDPTQFGAMLNTDHLRNLYGSLIGKNLNEIKIGTGAGKVGETVPYPQAVAEQQTAQAGAKAGAETGARIAAEDAPYVKTANDFQTGKVRWDQLSPKEQDAVGRILSPPGAERTTRMTDTENNTLTTLQDGLAGVRDMRKEMTGARMFMPGPWSDIAKEIPVVGAKWEGLQGRMGMLQATVGDLIKGGVLRESDRAAYNAMFPTIKDDPWTVQEKLGNLDRKLTGDIERYKNNLRAQSRFIPGDAQTSGAGPVGAGVAPSIGSFPGPRLLQPSQGQSRGSIVDTGQLISVPKKGGGTEMKPDLRIVPDGYTLVREGGQLKVVPQGQAKPGTQVGQTVVVTRDGQEHRFPTPEAANQFQRAVAEQEQRAGIQ